MKIFLLAFTFLALFSFNASAVDVRALNESEIKNYSNVPMKTIIEEKSKPFLNSKFHHGYCLDSDKWKTIRFEETKKSLDAGIVCFVNSKGDYHAHLRKSTDPIAQKYCNLYNRNALYRGPGKGKDTISETDAFLGILTLGLSSIIMAQNNMIVVSYVCEKNEDPKLVKAAELAKKKAKSAKFWGAVGNAMVVIAVPITIGLIIAYVIKTTGLFVKEIAIEASKRSSSSPSKTSQQGVSWSKLIIIVLVIIVGIFAINSFTSKPSTNNNYIIEKSSPSKSDKGFYFDNNKFQKGLKGMQDAIDPPKKKSTVTCFKSGEVSQAFNKICSYNCVGITYTINLGSNTAMCPLTIQR